MSKISIDNQTGCWNWTGYIDAGGYGRIMYRNHQESAHRVFYAWKVKKLPRGKSKYIPQLDHLCNNRQCCNPEHLELVSLKENILRGNSPSAKHARQTHCKNGHLLPKEFNYFKPNRKGVRICKICAYEHERSPERKIAQRKARLIRENGPRRKELLKNHREQEKARRNKLKHLAKTP